MKKKVKLLKLSKINFRRKIEVNWFNIDLFYIFDGKAKKYYFSFLLKFIFFFINFFLNKDMYNFDIKEDIFEDDLL